jgi:branched-chain amino acid transport system substrate-binding protein
MKHTPMIDRVRPTITAVLCIVATYALFISGCKDDDDVVLPDDTFKIGVMIPLTGSASSSGESISAALDIAIADVRSYLQSIGSPLDIELIIKDTESNPVAAKQRLRELMDADVRFVIGPYSSANAEAILSDANANDIFVLSPSSVSTSLAINGDNLYRLVPSDRLQAEAIAALYKHDSITIFIPVVRNDVWGFGLLSDASALLAAQGVTIRPPIIYDAASVNSMDIAGQVASAISSIPAEQLGHTCVHLMSFGEGTDILQAASLESSTAQVRWYGSSAFANNGTLLMNNAARVFAQEQEMRCPAFAPDPASADLWEPIAAQLAATLGRTPEVYALTSYDALWVMTLSYMLCNDPDDLAQFKASFAQLTSYYNGITGRMTLDAAGDRKYASYNFWGIEQIGNMYDWKSFGYYSNVNGQLVIY